MLVEVKLGRGWIIKNINSPAYCFNVIQIKSYGLIN